MPVAALLSLGTRVEELAVLVFKVAQHPRESIPPQSVSWFQSMEKPPHLLPRGISPPCVVFSPPAHVLPPSLSGVGFLWKPLGGPGETENFSFQE